MSKVVTPGWAPFPQGDKVVGFSDYYRVKAELKARSAVIPKFNAFYALRVRVCLKRRMAGRKINFTRWVKRSESE